MRNGHGWGLSSALALAAMTAMAVGGCGGSIYGVDVEECDHSRAPGIWNVSLDYGAGKTAVQRWTIRRYLCGLTIVAEPSDEYSPPSDHPVAFIEDRALITADWVNTVGACDYNVDTILTISGDSFKGPLNWRRSANSTGECLPAQGQILATAVRQ